MINALPFERFVMTEDGSPQIIQFDNFSIGIEYEKQAEGQTSVPQYMKLTLVDTDFLPPDVWVDLIRYVNAQTKAGFWRSLFINGRMLVLKQDLSQHEGLLTIDEFWNWK